MQHFGQIFPKMLHKDDDQDFFVKIRIFVEFFKFQWTNFLICVLKFWIEMRICGVFYIKLKIYESNQSLNENANDNDEKFALNFTISPGYKNEIYRYGV